METTPSTPPTPSPETPPAQTPKADLIDIFAIMDRSGFGYFDVWNAIRILRIKPAGRGPRCNLYNPEQVRQIIERMEESRRRGPGRKPSRSTIFARG